MWKTAIAMSAILLPLAMAACGGSSRGSLNTESRVQRICDREGYNKGSPEFSACVERNMEQQRGVRGGY